MTLLTHDPLRPDGGRAGRLMPPPWRSGGAATAAAASTNGVLVLLALLVFVGWPLAMMVQGAFRAGPDSDTWTAAALTALADTAVLAALGSSLALALASTVAATAVALLLAYAACHVALPGARLLTPSMFVVFAMPPFFYATGFALLGNPYTGWLNDAAAALATWLPWLRWLPKPLVDIESWGGILTVMTFKKIAFSYIFLLGPVRALSATHLEAALTAGARTGAAIWQQVSVLRLTLASLLLLNFAAGLQVFNEVLVLGAGQDLRTLSIVIYRFIHDFNPPDYARACAVALLFLSLTLPLVALQSRVHGRGSFVVIDGRNKRQTRRWALGRGGRGRGAAVAALWLWLAAAIALPVGTLVFASLQPFPGAYAHFDVDSYRRVFDIPRIGLAFRNTWLLGAAAGLAAMLIAVAAAYAVRKAPRWLARALRIGMLAPLAMPGIVSGLAVMWAYVSVPGLRHLYGTPWIMTAALIVVILPLAMQLARAAVAQVGPELREAALTAGAAPWRSFATIDLRLILPSFLAGWCLCGIILSGIIEIPLLLGSPATTTVLREAWGLYNTGDTAAAAALLVLLLLCLLAVAALALLLRRTPGGGGNSG